VEEKAPVDHVLIAEHCLNPPRVGKYSQIVGGSEGLERGYTARVGRLVGTVTKVVGAKSQVMSAGQPYRCDLRARIFRRKNKRLAVGDEVEFSVVSEPAREETEPGGEAGPSQGTLEGTLVEGEGVIEGVRPRRSALRRVRDFKRDQVICANVDQVFILVAVHDPPYKRAFIDRLIVACERDEIDAIVVFNKLDLCAEDYAELVAEDAAIYHALGYQTFLTSASSGLGVEELGQAFLGKISAVVGPSGAGKSTLLNMLCPGQDLRTGAVSESDGRGRHTTTAAELLPLPGEAGGFVVDTPGLRGFGLWDLEPTEVASGYRELTDIDCKYRNCLHRAEPGCGAAAAVESGLVDEERFESYLHLVEELLQDDQGRQNQRRR
jgi:ribosome biogenesis GTPase / thiamine phosphate phosphatase